MSPAAACLVLLGLASMASAAAGRSDVAPGTAGIGVVPAAPGGPKGRPDVAPGTAGIGVVPAVGELSTDDLNRALRLVDLLIDDGRLDDAEAFSRARAADQQDKSVWLLRLARIASAQGRPAEAVAFYRELLAKEGENAGLLLQLGTSALAAKEQDTARAAFEKARALDPGPKPPYYLSELAFSEGRAAEGERWAKEALAKLPDPAPPELRRMRLRLRSRLRWDDSLHEDFGRLFDEAPEDPEALFDWTEALLRAGYAKEAGEPLALLRERFAGSALRTRRYEAERLRRLGDLPAYAALLEDSVRRWPEEGAFHYSLGEQRYRARRWRAAAGELSLARQTPAYQRLADELGLELHRLYDGSVGPRFRWHESSSGHSLEAGATFRRYASENVRVEAEAETASFSAPSRGYDTTLKSMAGSAAWESGPWTAGGGARTTVGPGFGGVSPEAFGRWQPEDGWAVAGDAALRRPWTDAADAASVGARTDHWGLAWESMPLPRVSLGGQAGLDLHRLSDGSRARQSLAAPQLVLRALDRPFYLGLGYRFLAQDAWGEDAFFSRLGLIRRIRTHYATLSAGKRWLGGRLRTEAHAFNGGDAGRGRAFGSMDLAGAGAGLEWIGPALRLTGGYDFTRDAEGGIGGHSHTLSLALQWHWYGYGD